MPEDPYSTERLLATRKLTRAVVGGFFEGK
jgi:hypothetical protein